MRSVTRPGPLIATIVFVVLGLTALALSIYALPTRLTVAVGPDERDHARVMTAFARKLQTDRAPVRLTLVRKENYASLAAALDSGEVDLAVVRSDVMPRRGLTVAVLSEMPMMFVVTGAARVRSLADLKGRRVGVLRGTAENMALLDTVLRHAGVDPRSVTRVALTPEDVASAIDQQRVDVVMPVGPLQGNGGARVQALLQRGQRPPRVFGVEEAEAMAVAEPMLEAVELPRGALVGTPPLPAEPLPTLAVTQRLVARTALAHSVVFDLTRLLFTSRVALAAETPMAKQVHAPETDTGEALSAALPLHPGAAAYLAGDQNRFFDRYGDLFYVGSMLLTGLVSGIGALISFMLGRRRQNAAKFTRQLLDLLARARQAPDEAALRSVEQQADDLLALAFGRLSSGDIGNEQFDTFATVNDSVQQAIARRAAQLRAAAPA
ncbi:TAXI family TRAP transporter solute-binding subunit [Ottowia sp.]|uniref:TAXI family TRAP transporter solute-binding subunit n=1 Tax=Ottowia sp. TaxID=1898956 RepID=UPI002C053DD9|nr:TAXI family TRAP transporter solute-binding subunit [Ottowia sp.]HOB67635.1 TAXI family TRAP transporter solute-binding subunit [Ottowia sp.]HPZ57403.1 TAXI family TRAP transporter solute-binding subunit [Ottowia sp.]HQD47182.1 TAXI family TRAP transporter solute-binding subunit [Ottowia sp.]